MSTNRHRYQKRKRPGPRGDSTRVGSPNNCVPLVKAETQGKVVDCKTSSVSYMQDLQSKWCIRS